MTGIPHKRKNTNVEETHKVTNVSCVKLLIYTFSFVIELQEQMWCQIFYIGIHTFSVISKRKTSHLRSLCVIANVC